MGVEGADASQGPHLSLGHPSSWGKGNPPACPTPFTPHFLIPLPDLGIGQGVSPVPKGLARSYPVGVPPGDGQEEVARVPTAAHVSPRPLCPSSPKFHNSSWRSKSVNNLLNLPRPSSIPPGVQGVLPNAPGPCPWSGGDLTPQEAESCKDRM